MQPHASSPSDTSRRAASDASWSAPRFPMGALRMSGSFPLDATTIDRAVSRTSAGNFALGYLDGDVFVVFYVGRSDSDVRSRLHEWVDAPSMSGRGADAAQAPWSLHARSGSPLAAPALGRASSGVASAYTRFAYSYAPSPAAAFEEECRNFDDFGGGGGLDNSAPPVATPT